jgi:superfamily II DNA/RNA helicase
MSSFVHELADRLSSHPTYWAAYRALQCSGAAATLPQTLQRNSPDLSLDQHHILLYCASVFVQTDEDRYKAMAQSIALNSLLMHDMSATRDRCVRILTELGNFPGLTYAEKNYPSEDLALIAQLQLRISRELNTVAIGDDRLPLTDYQKMVWDLLPNAHALAISAPTSAGKSFLVIEHMCRLACTAPSFLAVYVAPTRALLSEVHQTIKARISDVVGIRVSSIPSLDVEDNPKQIFVLTQERLQVLLAITNFQLDLLIIDEAQNLSDGPRGMILQECIDQVIQRNQNTRIIMLAPGAEGFREAASSVGLANLDAAVTTVSPVLQNRIIVSKTQGKNELTLKLLESKESHKIGVITTSRGFENPATRLAAVALELGAQGGSLVYATGPSESEKVALQLTQDCHFDSDKRLTELGEFIEKHIHGDYALASMVRKGVAFHYGKMPNLLREAIETAFKSGAVRFLTCTTTLFQGVNLPARNVFIGTPTRGKGTNLDPALLWNFAGRAGRMKRDVVGNVFLVDYEHWEHQPMSDLVRFKIAPAFKHTVIDAFDEVVSALGGEMPKLIRNNEQPMKVRAATGLLIARAAQGNVANFVKRVLPELSADKLSELAKAATNAAQLINLPAPLLATNWTIDPFGQKRLYDKLVQKIHEGDFEKIIPINPHEPDTYGLYSNIFNLISKEINGYEGNVGGFVAVFAIPWMKGYPYPVIVSKAIKKERERLQKLADKKNEKKGTMQGPNAIPAAPVDVSKVVRYVFDVIEDVVRFQFVQFGKMYIDLLTLALKTEDKADLIPDIFDFSLALELGVATTSSKSYVELGLSRIAATALDQLHPNSNLNVMDARKWLAGLDIKATGLNQVIIDELDRLGLLSENATKQA